MSSHNSLLLLVVSFIVFTSIPSAKSENITCKDYLLEVVNNIIAYSKVDPAFAPFLLNTGKDLNDMGYYQNCQADKTMRYITLRVKLPQTTARLGLCGPRVCGEKEYAEALANERQGLNNFINSTLGVDISGLKVEFDDPEILKDTGGVSTAFAFGAWGILLTLVALGTILDIIISSFIIKKSTAGGSVLQAAREAAKAVGGSGENVSVINKTINSKENSVIDRPLDAPLMPAESAPKFKPNPIVTFLLNFSFTENMRKVFDSRDGGDKNLNVFNGVRMIAICWVIYGHEYNARANNAMNLLELPLTVTSDWALVVTAGVYAVDVFFFMSAFFFTYIFLSKLEKMRFNGPTYILTLIHRILRLWPAMVLCLLFWWRVMPFVTSGPLWNEFLKVQPQVCDNRWWSNMLFVDNYFNSFGTGYCFGWGWYLSNDMQMFLLAPIVAYVYHKNKSQGKILTYFLIVLSTAWDFYLGLRYHFRIAIPVPGAPKDFLNDYFNKFYYMPWGRMNVYFLGTLAAFWYRSYMKNEEGSLANKVFRHIKESQITRLCLYIVGVFLMNYFIFAPHPLLKDPTAWGDLRSTFFIDFGRMFFVIGLGLIILCAMLDETSWFRKIMSAPVFEPLAKVQYMAYLIHPIVLNMQTYGSNNSLYYSNQAMFYNTLTDLVIIFFFSLILHVIIEQSMINLETKYLFPRKPSQGKKIQNDESAKTKEEV